MCVQVKRKSHIKSKFRHISRSHLTSLGLLQVTILPQLSMEVHFVVGNGKLKWSSLGKKKFFFFLNL